MENINLSLCTLLLWWLSHLSNFNLIISIEVIEIQGLDEKTAL